MNRQMKRSLQGEERAVVDSDPIVGDPVVATAPKSRVAAHPQEPRRASLGGRVAQYLREVRAELAKVLWPKRSEIVNYSTVVFTTLVLIALLIFGLNYLFARGVLFLFK